MTLFKVLCGVAFMMMLAVHFAIGDEKSTANPGTTMDKNDRLLTCMQDAIELAKSAKKKDDKDCPKWLNVLNCPDSETKTTALAEANQNRFANMCHDNCSSFGINMVGLAPKKDSKYCPMWLYLLNCPTDDEYVRQGLDAANENGFPNMCHDNCSSFGINMVGHAPKKDPKYCSMWLYLLNCPTDDEYVRQGLDAARENGFANMCHDNCSSFGINMVGHAPKKDPKYCSMWHFLLNCPSDDEYVQQGLEAAKENGFASMCHDGVDAVVNTTVAPVEIATSTTPNNTVAPETNKTHNDATDSSPTSAAISVVVSKIHLIHFPFGGYIAALRRLR